VRVRTIDSNKKRIYTESKMNKIEKKLNRMGCLMALAFLMGMLFVGIYKRHLLLTHFQFTKGIVTEITAAGWKSSAIIQFYINIG